MKNFIDTDALAIGITVIILTILLIFAGPFCLFWLGYFSGWVAKITIGKWIIAGMGLFGLDLSLNKIPLLAGTIAALSSFAMIPHPRVNTTTTKE